MIKNLRVVSLGIIFIFALSACSLFSNPSGNNNTLLASPVPTPVAGLGLAVSYDTSVPLDAVGQSINYAYLVTNTSGAPIPGPISVTDDRAATTCPEVTTIGNLDNNLDINESITCSGTYPITQLDLNAGSVSDIATATAGENYSSAATTTVPLQQNRGLTLSKSADPLSFNAAGQTINYSYLITNSGNITLGPAQFTVTDDKISAPFFCGADGTTLDPGGTITCSATYITTAADVSAGLVTNTATATEGTTVSTEDTTTINTGTITNPNPSNLQPGTTIQHQVVIGEWLWQIARCYGADPKQVIASNPQLADPAKISPGITVTVPNIGANGRTIYGPPCVGTHTVQAGETWASIAQLYNADPLILQDVNPGALSTGRVLKVPLNSAGG